MTIDWERPPFSIGTVTAKGDKSFDVRVLDEFPVKGGEPVQAFMDYDPKTRLPRRHGLDVYHGVDTHGAGRAADGSASILSTTCTSDRLAGRPATSGLCFNALYFSHCTT